MSRTQKALTLQVKQGDYVIDDIPIPTPARGEVLVKVMAAGLNPVDYGIKAYGLIVENYPAVLGCEYAGIVEEVGEGVIDFKVGDHVCVYYVFTLYIF